MNTRITPELLEEAKARELIRQIQEERKIQGLTLAERVRVKAPWLPKKEELLKRIKAKTLADNISVGDFGVTKSS